MLWFDQILMCHHPRLSKVTPLSFALCLHLKETTSSSFLLSHFPLCLFHASSISFFQTTFSRLIFSNLHGIFGTCPSSFFLLFNEGKQNGPLHCYNLQGWVFFSPLRTWLLGFYPSLPWRRDLAVWASSLLPRHHEGCFPLVQSDYVTTGGFSAKDMCGLCIVTEGATGQVVMCMLITCLRVQHCFKIA